MSSFTCPHCGTALLVTLKNEPAVPDQITHFLMECCELDPAAREAMSNVLTAYADWCRRRGEFAMSTKAFGRIIHRYPGIEPARSNGRRYYRGLRLIG